MPGTAACHPPVVPGTYLEVPCQEPGNGGRGVSRSSRSCSLPLPPPPHTPTRYNPYPPYQSSWRPAWGGQSKGLAPTYAPVVPPPPKVWTKKGENKDKMTQEILALRREVNRLKDAQRDVEQVEDEVWIRDGRIFFKHRCNGALLEQEISKGWRVTSAGDITPSFSCRACNAHFHATVIVQLRRVGWAKPADFVQRWSGGDSWKTPTSPSSPTQPSSWDGWSTWKGVGF